MRIDFFLVVLFETKDKLYRRRSIVVIWCWANEPEFIINRHLGSVLKYVCRGFLTINFSLHDLILINTDGREEIKCALITGTDAVEYKAHDNILPCGRVFVPKV